MKYLNQKVNELWHSRNKDMGEKGLLWFALFFLVIDILMIIACGGVNNFVCKILLEYMSLAFSFLLITLVSTYFYIYSKKQIVNWLEMILKLLYKVCLCLCFIVCIPIMLFLRILEIILNYRAKKIDNIIRFLIILLIDLSIIMVFCNFNAFIVSYIASCVVIFFNVDISVFPTMLFLLLSLFKVEMDLANLAIFKITNYREMPKIKKEIMKKNTHIRDKFRENMDIKKFMEDKENILKNVEDDKTESLKYDIEYQLKTIWKFQLLCLIGLFSVATFMPQTLPGNQSDTINVITVFTLIMLYIDKRKEWK